MGDPRSWTPRRAHNVRDANAAADRDRDRDRLLVAPIYEHSVARNAGKQGPHFLNMHPCDTSRVFRFKVVATCAGCLGSWPVSRYDFDDSPLEHVQWAFVMRELVCPKCASCPRDIRFQDEDGSDVGAISTSRELTLNVSTATPQITKPAHSRGQLDPFAQYGDGY